MRSHLAVWLLVGVELALSARERSGCAGTDCRCSSGSERVGGYGWIRLLG